VSEDGDRLGDLAVNGGGVRIEFAAGEAPQGDVTPEEAAKIRSSVAAREQAPSTRLQASFVNWREAADQLGSPFAVEHIPVSKLRAMRRDPMLGFGLNFIKTPIVRAKWHASAKSNQGANAAIAAHLDHDLRRIYASLVLMDMNKLDFGFQAIAKRFELGTPAATYVETDPDSGEQEEKPVWSEGSVQPIRWKPFVSLAPEYVEPIWTGQGDFNGISFKLEDRAAPGGVVGASSGSGGNKEFKIDVYHALWSTNERDQNFGSLFGYPRLGYAYRYWWSYWFRWAIADRAFEKKADPSIVVRHPDGEFLDERTGETTTFREYALLMGERLRSGSTIALPSQVYMGEVDGKPSTTPEWDIKFLTDGVDFDPFDKSFEYLDVQKLRSLFIPEQAFLEGKGGTSSRNVAAESQAVLATQFVEGVNRWVIPQWLAVNYPEFMADGGKAEIIMSGFADEDVEFTRQIIQMIGQQEEGAREIAKLVDLERVLERAGTPIAELSEQQRRERLAEEAAAAAAAPPATTPAPGGVGVIPTATGFTYINGPEERNVLYLSDTGTQFLEKLPPSPHYADSTIRGFARQLWTEYHDLYRDEYETLIGALENEELALTDDGVELAISDYIDRANEIISRLPGSERWPNVIRRSIDIFDRIAQRASRIETRKANLSVQFNEDEWSEWRTPHVSDVAMTVSETTRMELRDFIAAKLNDGVADIADIAREAREHFSGFPGWKADRLVRTEVRDVYNAATLLSARAAGVATVQATDADGGDSDSDCVQRDGQLFEIDEALREREHPNGTLAWRILPVELSIERVDEVPDAPEGAIGRFVKEDGTLYLSNDVSKEDERKFLLAVGDSLSG
jgi:hypothetical protein